MTLVFADYEYDPVRRELRHQGTALKVDPQLLDLLACFLDSPGILLSREQLISRVWNGRATSDSALSVAVAKLRKALGQGAERRELIENRYGRGYRFVAPVNFVRQSLSAAPASGLPPTAAGAPLVGRADVLRQLDAALSRALAGEGSVCALLGESGIGKTRLAETVERSARKLGVLTAWARFFASEDTPPLWPIAQVLRELNRDDLATTALALLSERTTLPMKQPVTELSQLSDDDSASSHRTIDEVCQALFRLSGRAPIALFLEDLHWADAASLRALNYLIPEISRWPLLIVVTAHSAGLEQAKPDLRRFLSHYKCDRIEIPRLRPSEVAEYISALFERDESSLAQAVYSRSEGNPFFMIELLRPWIGRTVPEAEQLRLSSVALDPVRQRLTDVPEEARRVLSAAAVIGHDFDLGLLSRVTERGHDALLEALDGSLANDIIVASSYVSGAFAFDHELIREVLYADLSASERCRLHLRVAEGLQQRARGGDHASHAELAHHFLSALPQGQVNVAIDHARRAAAIATRMASHADARALLRRAYEARSFWLEPDPEVLAAMLLELAIVERVLGDPAYVAHARQGIALAREHRCGPLLTTAGCLLSPNPGILSRSEATDALRAAAEVLPESDYARRAIVLAHLAWTPPNSLSGRAANALLEEARTLAERSCDPEAIASVRDGLMFFRAGPTTQAQAEAIADEIDRGLSELSGEPRWSRAGSTTTQRLIFAMQRGDQLALDIAIDRRAELLAQMHNSELNWHHERMLIVMQMNRGDFAEVSVALETLRQRAERLRLHAWPALWALDYSQLLLWTGDVTVMAERMKTGFVLTARESPITLARKLRYMIEFGFLAEARSALAALSIEAIEDFPHDREYLSVIFNLAMIAADVGDEEKREVIYRLLAPHARFYAASISFHNEGSISHALGVLARVRSEPRRALGHFEEACASNAKAGLKARALQSQFELATLLLDVEEVRDVERGRRLLGELHEAARALGLAPLVRAVEQRIV